MIKKTIRSDCKQQQQQQKSTIKSEMVHIK